MEWIKIKIRELTQEEIERFAEQYENKQDMEDFENFAYDCPLPEEDGVDVLVTTKWGSVTTDTFCRDYYGCYFETYDWNEITAWMPFPEPFKEHNDEKEES